MKTRLLRLALLAGVLVFGAVVWQLRRSGGAPPAVSDPRTLLVAGRAIWVAALLGCSALFYLILKSRDAVRTRTLSLVAWALGEVTALYGGVVYLLAGTPLFYQLGLGFMVLCFLAFPGDLRR
ncbi:MAG: hypothetical protein U0163_14715 [Gemmatimonadaceae bacterium]